MMVLVRALTAFLFLATVARSFSADNPSLDPQAGIAALQKHDFPRARQIFSALVEQNASAENLNYLGMAEASQGALPSAITHFRESMRKGNNTAVVHYNLGLAYVRNHQDDLGITELKMALAIDPSYSLAMYALGVSLVDTGRAKDGIPYLTRVVDLRPQAADAWANLVRAYFAAGDTKHAESTIDSASSKFPDNVRIAVTLADLCMRYQRIQKARYLLENGSGIASDNLTVKLMLAKASLLAGEPIEALAVLKDVPSDAGGPGEVNMLKGQAEALTKHFDEASADLTSAIEADPNNSKYLVALAWLKQLRGLHNEALCVLRTAQDLDPGSPYIAYRMAISYFLTGKASEASQVCMRAIHTSSSFDRLYFLQGMIRLAEGRYDLAAEAFNRAVEVRPSTALYRRQLGVAQLMGRRLTEAQAQFDRALSLDPNDADSYYWRGKTLALQGQRTKAIQDLQAAVTIDPKLGQAFTELAELYSGNGQPTQASAMREKASSLRGSKSPDDIEEYIRNLQDASP
jgi:tetratricopeptide (TPR) repeat protein